VKYWEGVRRSAIGPQRSYVRAPMLFGWRKAMPSGVLARAPERLDVVEGPGNCLWSLQVNRKVSRLTREEWACGSASEGEEPQPMTGSRPSATNWRYKADCSSRFISYSSFSCCCGH
jgi:hypothetical protein